MTYNKIDGKNKPDWIDFLTVDEVKKFLCEKMDVNLAYKDASTTTLTPFAACNVHGSDFS